MLSPTPTTNATLAFRTGGFSTLAEGLDYAARGDTGMNFYSPRGDLVRVLSYRELRERAVDLAGRLTASKLRRGDRVAVIAETNADFLIFFFGCQYAGLVPVPLPLSINFGGRDAYEARLRGMLMAAGARAAVASEELIGALRMAAARTAVSLVGTPAEFYALPAGGGVLQPLQGHEACYIQYSSGSTSFPRGVLVTQRAITANARSIAEDGIALRSGDRCVSWLPLYHDMGLVGCCLTPVLTQITVDYLASTSFARRPLVWLKLISQNRGTISFGPTFGYELCARRAATADIAGLDLSSWRVAGIGGEMIRPSALREFEERFGGAGFRASAFVPSFGLAEATLAVTFSGLGRGVRVDTVERGDAIERQRLALPAAANSDDGARRTRSFVICGKPMKGYAVEIRDEHNRSMAERRIGRVCIQGPSLMSGYFRNPDATRAVTTADGWLDTGDLGYLVDGELVVTGRSKDLIIFSGRNIWPQDIEWAVEHVEGVRRGDVAAFAVTGDDDMEKVVVVAECRVTDPDSLRALRREIAATVHRVAGVDGEIVLAPPRSLQFTTSGKLSRAAARQSYVDGEIRDIEPGMAAMVPAMPPERLAAAV
ncbi:MAG TPA: fatty acyl-AMP ligase [Geminicoccaceae bacterium]|nr:fatty acyl-AMP ligase [Geminicoccus sp.]HMU51212.1 fatty acyl-AMP ligase [Geminicoccaceae bacterium]